jgi:hypothetical protein
VEEAISVRFYGYSYARRLYRFIVLPFVLHSILGFVIQGGVGEKIMHVEGGVGVDAGLFLF